jgi:ubiquitin-like domain-containing CTD phosphatase 1
LLNEPRPGKKLLVLDIDYTLFDHRSAAETGNELMRPFLHEFLTAAYNVCIMLGIFFNINFTFICMVPILQDYDIMIWSATSMVCLFSILQNLKS